MAKDVFTGWLQTLDTECLERVHAEVVDLLDLIERELGRRDSQDLRPSWSRTSSTSATRDLASEPRPTTSRRGGTSGKRPSRVADSMPRPAGMARRDR